MKELVKKEKKFLNLHKIIFVLTCFSFLTAVFMNNELLIYPVILLLIVNGLCLIKRSYIQTKIRNGLGHDDEEYF